MKNFLIALAVVATAAVAPGNVFTVDPNFCRPGAAPGLCADVDQREQSPGDAASGVGSGK